MKSESVAVIGCGPGGMFFCHAMETRRQALIQSGQIQQAEALPRVTCFERTSGPGGVWKAQTEGGTPNMYAALWTNGPSHSLEFFDYTFEDHFDKPISVYMPRQDLLDYMIARVTRNCPHFFEKYAKFRHEVANVVFDESTKQFTVQVRNLENDTVETQLFDKCIWACGENGRKKMPTNLVDMLKEGGYQGKIIHSTDTSHLDEDVRGKRVLMIGGGLSAEDLALQAIKLGAQQIYVAARDFTREISWTNEWPLGKVEVLLEQTPVSVTESGRCIQLGEVEYVWPYSYKFTGRIMTELRDIDTVIFCTGYEVNFDMLDKSLCHGIAKWGLTHQLDVPKDWQMKPNPVSEMIGYDVPVGEVVYYNSCTVHPPLYRGVLIENPNMMFLSSYDSDYPLLSTDVYAWLLAGYVSGQVPQPSPEEMKRMNHEQALQQLDMPAARYYMDKNYFDAVNDVGGNEIWLEETERSKMWYDCIEQAESLYYVRCVARAMAEGKYPLNLGTFDQLNDKAQMLIDAGNESYRHRADCETDENPWKTYRDYDTTSACVFRSFCTGSTAVPLEKPWMDIDVAPQVDTIPAVSPSPKRSQEEEEKKEGSKSWDIQESEPSEEGAATK